MFLKIGHRGARAYETENTLESFEKAIALGVNAIEFDLQMTADKKPAVIHDDNLKRVFGHDVFVYESTLKELKDLTENRIPSFGEAIEFINGRVDKILVELKQEGPEEKVLDVLNKSAMADRIIIVSFHESAIAEVRRLHTKIETGLIYTDHKNPVEAAMQLNAQYLLPLFRFTHSKNVEQAHKNNLKVLVWTINTKEEAAKFRAKGVDGIASDKPDIL
jgi:glycerophosphoryl diester phosphodiesterase